MKVGKDEEAGDAVELMAATSSLMGEARHSRWAQPQRQRECVADEIA